MTSSIGPVLAKQIGAIEQTVSRLCVRTARLLTEVETRQLSVALTALVAELYFLGDAWRRLRIRLEAASDAASEPGAASGTDTARTLSDPSEVPLLAECTCLLRALDAHLEQLSPEAALELQAAALDYRKHVLDILSHHDVADIYSFLSEFQGGSSFGLSESLISQVKPPSPLLPASTSSASSPTIGGSSGASPASSAPYADVTESQILRWIDLLLSPELDREPEEFYQERLSLYTFRARHPRFSQAATNWPLHAEAFWPTLKPFMSSYFKVGGPYNWVHWVLEYARETFPSKFDPAAPCQDAILDLTEHMCRGSIHPLHFAAALGLPSLCAELVSIARGAQESFDCDGPYGTPLFCALIGPKVLTMADSAAPWEDVFYFPLDRRSRAKTVMLFLDADSDVLKQLETSKGAERYSYVGLALWVSLVTGNERVLSSVLARGAPLDEDLISLLTDATFLQHGCKESRLFVSLLTMIFDELLQQVLVPEGLSDLENEMIEIIDGLMSDCDLSFSLLGKERRVKKVPDSRFAELVHDVLYLEDTPHVLRRLSLDPRFDPNQPWVEDADSSGTLLHMAVSGSLAGVIDVLLERGADLAALDREGRTPLLLAESAEILDKLVKEHGDTTTSADIYGRNIWHYAAASNDTVLLTWLIANDPWKEENLKATTTRGCTPAAEAFLFINELAATPKEHKPQVADTARLILKECKGPEHLKSDRSLAHLAAAWGDEELVEGLVAAGVDFREIDKHGQSALHHLNSWASKRLVRRLQGLCKGLAIANDYGETPAETMLKNIALFEIESSSTYRALSAHPSCYRVYSDGYAQVLTPQVLVYRDYRGRDLWERVCDRLVTHNYQQEEMAFFREMIMSAIVILASRGVLKLYEETKGRSALYGLAVPSFSRGGLPRFKPCERYAVIRLVMSLCDKTMAAKALRSDDGIQLLVDAIEGRCNQAMHYLAPSVPLHRKSVCLAGRTVLEYVITEAIDVANIIFTYATEEELAECKPRLLEVVRGMPADERASWLDMFRLRGVEIRPDEIEANNADGGDDGGGAASS